MGTPMAKAGDRIVATDTHVVMPASPSPAPTPLPHMFSGVLDEGLVSSVLVADAAVAVVGSKATNTPPHLPAVVGSFQQPPSNRATITQGSATVFAGGKPVARSGDPAITCNDPADAPVGSIVATGTVFAG